MKSFKFAFTLFIAILTSLLPAFVSAQNKPKTINVSGPVDVAKIKTNDADRDPNVAIVNGSPVMDTRFDGVVTITIQLTGKLSDNPKEQGNYCTGTLISSDMVLTAAHCLCEERGRFDLNQHFVAITNTYTDLKSSDLIKIAKSEAMECPKRDILTPGKDLALLRLERAVQTMPIWFASQEDIDRAKSFTIVGFGATDAKGEEDPRSKLWTTIPSVDNSCSAESAKISGCKEGQDIWAGARATGDVLAADSCKGDSGGPLFIVKEANALIKSRHFVLAGVVSRGAEPFSDELVCGNSGIYTRLTEANKDWIYRTIAKLGGQQPSSPFVGSVFVG